MGTFDRYSQFRKNGEIELVPFGEIPVVSTDERIIFRRGEMRLDQISYDYYGSSDYAWLIMQANPQYGSLEYYIPDGVELRIPFPLEDAISRYKESIETYNKYNK
jgi:hypothetical protein